MKFSDNFSICDNGNCVPIFTQDFVPVFQNKVYNTEGEALQALSRKVELVQSLTSGFIFNKCFDPDIMNYDSNYQNEQSNSLVFKNHLREVINLLETFGLTNEKIIEVGCGKGVFFEMMLKKGWNCWGFDPTYEGVNPRIKKEYFGIANRNINADVIIMRHTLEHIPNPFSFLHTIAQANDYKGQLFVEVPTIEWILKKNAFWDIFFEHCNYFTEASLGVMFDESRTGHFFGEQYIYLWADLSKLRQTIPPQNITPNNFSELAKKVDECRRFLKEKSSIAIWGAGAKGSTFVNLLDRQRKHVQYVIDNNPAKQSKHIGCTGHKIFSPEILGTQPVENILVMNENYLNEIKESLRGKTVNIFNL